VLDHLIDFDPPVEDHAGVTPVEKLAPVEVVNAQIQTADWLKAMGVKDDEEIKNEADVKAAREAFTSLTTAAPLQDQHSAVTQIQAPAAVRHLTGMLTAYDWEFVQQAKELRGYAVAKILEECEHPTASIRLKALQLLGKVTEVGLFTDKIEVKKTDLTEAEIDAKLKEKLAKFMDVSDADIVDIEPVVKTQQPSTSANPDENDIDPENPDAS
jgi:hypothetical protein